MKLELDGFEIIENVISDELLSSSLSELKKLEKIRNSGGIRNAEKKLSFIPIMAQSNGVKSILKKYLPGEVNLVRAIVFDKTPESNWLVTWHQDKTVAVNRKANIPGWGPWSIKDGVHHVQPPIEVLESMLTVRIHLDDTSIKNGCLKVIPRSHQQGILDQLLINKITNSSQVFNCEMPAKGAIVMKPHILHSSSKSFSSLNRRVVHLEFSNYMLGYNLKWANL